MRESTWRKLDKIYMTRRRRLLAQTYCGDPSDPVNTHRILRAELTDTPTSSRRSWRRWRS